MANNQSNSINPKTGLGFHMGKCPICAANHRKYPKDCDDRARGIKKATGFDCGMDEYLQHKGLKPVGLSDLILKKVKLVEEAREALQNVSKEALKRALEEQREEKTLKPKRQYYNYCSECRDLIVSERDLNETSCNICNGLVRCDGIKIGGKYNEECKY